MMPRLLPNSLPGLSASPSTSRAPERGAFPKPFTDRIHAHEASAAHPSASKAVRLFHTPALQTMRVQSRLHPVTEVAKVGPCADQRTSMQGRAMSKYNYLDLSSVCLFSMDFSLDTESACTESIDSCNSLEEAMFNRLAPISNSLQSLLNGRDDLEIKLLRDVQAIVESWEDELPHGYAHMDRKCMVLNALRRIGYDAAICKARWDHSSSLPGGDYQYIDVLVASNAAAEPLRLLVDIEFQAQFEIARPSSEFSAVLQIVPPIFVGRPEMLQQVVHLMADAMKQSLQIMGLHLPPWRKLNYMRAKWFSSYERIANKVAGSSRKHADDSISGGSFAGIVMRKDGLNPGHMNELGALHDASKRLRRGSKDAIVHSNVRENLITVTMTNWQPPPVEVRSHLHARSERNVTGLASMLLNEVVAKAA